MAARKGFSVGMAKSAKRMAITLSDAQLLAEAQKETEAWQRNLRAGVTEKLRNRPVCAEEHPGLVAPITSFPESMARALEHELYGTSENDQ